MASYWSGVNAEAFGDRAERALVQELKARLLPYTARPGTPDSQTRVATPLHAPLTLCERQRIPRLLAPFYACYGADTEFSCSSNAIVFFSRSNMARHCRSGIMGLVDFAYTPTPLHNTIIHTLVLRTGQVVTSRTTGSTQAPRAMLLETFVYEGRRSRGIAVYTDFTDWWHSIKKMHDQT